jgi:hypothetical protein
MLNNHRQDAASALDEVPATYFEWEQQDHLEALAGIREGILCQRSSKNVFFEWPPDRGNIIRAEGAIIRSDYPCAWRLLTTSLQPMAALV